jgi:hypothetical protein
MSAASSRALRSVPHRRVLAGVWARSCIASLS